MFSSTNLRASGFEGFVTWAALDTAAVPKVGGVYVVLRPETTSPAFQAVSCGGHFKGQDPSVPVSQLRAKWIVGAETVYIGMATSLRNRLGQYRSFGAGKPVGHWGGRYIWQLPDPQRLEVCWKATDQAPKAEESALLHSFVQQYGSLPFANLRF